MKKTILLIATVFSVATIMFVASPVMASITDPCSQGYVQNVDGICSPIGAVQNPSTLNVYGTIARVISWLLIGAGVLAAIMIIFSGIRYATSGGDAEKVKKAKSTLMWSVIGLALALLAAFIVNLTIDIVGRI